MDPPAASDDSSPHIQEVESTALTTRPSSVEISTNPYFFPFPPPPPPIFLPTPPPPVIISKSSTWQNQFLKLMKSRPFTTAAFTAIFFLIILAIPAGIRVHCWLRENAQANRELERQFESLQEQADYLQDQIQEHKEDADVQHSEQEAKQSKLDTALQALLVKYYADHDALLKDLQGMKRDTGLEFKNLKHDITLYRAANELSKKRAFAEFRRSQEEYYDTIAKILKRLDDNEQDADNFMEKTEGELTLLTNACLENYDAFAAHKKSTCDAFDSTTDAIRSLNVAVADVGHNFAQTTSTLKGDLQNLSDAHARDRSKIERLAENCDALEETTKSHQQKLQLVDKHGKKIAQLVNATDDLKQTQTEIGSELENNRVKNVGNNLLYTLKEDKVTNRPRQKALARRARQRQAAADSNRQKIFISLDHKNTNNNSV